MYRLRWIAALCAFFYCGCLVAAPAATVIPLQIEDAVGATIFHLQSLPDISPDNAYVAYTACDQKKALASNTSERVRGGRTGEAYLSAGCDVFLQPVRGGAARNLTGSTDGSGASWGPKWSPDGRWLTFFSTRGDGYARLYVWDRTQDRIRLVSRAVTDTSLGFVVGAWLPDSRHMIVPLMRVTKSPNGPAVAARSTGTQTTLVLYRSTPPPPGASQSTFIPSTDHDYDVDLALVDVSTGVIRSITPDAHTGLTSGQIWLSPDGRKLAFFSDHGRRNSTSNTMMRNLEVVNVQTLTVQQVAADVEQQYPEMSWSPDSSSIAYTSGAVKASTSVMGTPNANCYVVSVQNATVHQLASDPVFDNDYIAPLWDSSSKFVYMAGAGKVWRGDVASGTMVPITGDIGAKSLVSTGGRNQIWSPDHASLIAKTFDNETKMEGFAAVSLTTDQVRQLMLKAAHLGGSFDLPIVSPDGSMLVYTSESADQPVDLWVTSSSFSNDRRLTDISPRLDSYTFGKSMLIHFTSAKGEPLQAALLLPPNYTPGTRLPTVVWVYASDSGSSAVNTFGLVGISAYNMQMLQTRGYAVLWPDIPVHLGTPMHDLVDAVLPAVDAAAAQGYVDPNRLAVMGQSNGGYSTLSIIVQTNRFKAAVMNAGFGDLTAFYGSMTPDGSGAWNFWLESSGGGMGVPPWEDPQRYVDNSPVYYLDRITTPLIIQAGGADPDIVPYSDEVFSDLKRLHKDVTYLRYGGESHVLEAYANLQDYWTRVLAFFAANLGA